MKVLFVVTHLLGTGHLSRTLTLARAFAEAGHAPTVISGGLPAPHLDGSNITLVQLPALRSDGTDFSTLLDADGAPATPAYLAARARLMVQTLHDTRPDALITELYPFGRKSLAAEFTAILTAAQDLPQPPVILASIRDILAPPRKPRKAERAAQIIAAHYDGVLVHSDPDVTPLGVSWPVDAALQAKLRYTGYVSAPMPASEPEASREILVSAGGGAVGRHLYEAALQAAHLAPQHLWRVLVGGKDAADLSAELTTTAPPNAIIEPVRPDFRALLPDAACSVSMCGYNTALDVLQARCRAVFVPFDDGVEVEQGLRAASLASRPQIAVLNRADLTPHALLEHITQVLAAPRPQAEMARMDGAAQTVATVQSMARARP